MKNFTENDTLGHIVTKFPEAAVLFLSHQVDYGYHGDMTLLQAVNQESITLDQMLTSLNLLYSDFLQCQRPFIDWSNEPTDHLIDHLLKVHLPALREEMTRLNDSILNHASASVDHKTLLSHLQGYLTPVSHSLEKHLAKEEAVFFAVLTYYQETNLIETLRDLHGIIDDLDAEHEALTEGVTALQNVLNDAIDQASTHEPTLTLITNLKHFTHMITEHIHLENNLLFKQI